jgi:superfamily II DNA or RNA helicase
MYISFFKTIDNGNILIIVPTEALLDQWYVSLIEDLECNAEDIACFSGVEKQIVLQK